MGVGGHGVRTPNRSVTERKGIMVNARDLLGQLLQSGLSGAANERLGRAMGPSGLGGGGNPLSEIFSQLSGLTQGGMSMGGMDQAGMGQGRMGQAGMGQEGMIPGGMSDSFGQGSPLEGLVRQAGAIFGQAGGAVRSGNPLAIGGLAALAGALLGGGRGASRGALGGGLLAVLGSLAYSALQGRAQPAMPGTASAMQPPLGLFEPASADEDQALEEAAGLVIQAMLNAAKADGEIDPTERSRILGKLAEDGADAEALAFVEREMQAPGDPAALVRAVAGRQELAVQVYAASLLAIEVDTPAEVDYLSNLAASLGLDADIVGRVHDALGVGGPSGAPH